MYKTELNWKEFKVDLSKIETRMKASFPGVYMHNQALPERLELYFSEAISQEDLDSIQDYWESIEDDSEEATSYKPRLTEEQLVLKLSLIKQAKLALIEKTWANMSSTERKLAVNLEDEVSLEELQDLLG